MKIVVLGLSVTSSWGNGHATTYRALLSALHRRGHKIVFFEKDEEWYASNRDLPSPAFCDLRLIDSWKTAQPQLREEFDKCDAAVLGSFFPYGTRAAQEILESNIPAKIFFDIDTPITFSKLQTGGAEYLRPEQVAGFDLYLSFTAGPLLEKLKSEFGARKAVPFYCTFDPNTYYPRPASRRYACALSYMGTYAGDRQAKLEKLFLSAARQLPEQHLILAGSQYPKITNWPRNVKHIRHLSPRLHPRFYSSSRLTLNLTRAQMVEWGFSPSVRLFEAAACACPVVSDRWAGLETLFAVGDEILVAENSADIIALMTECEDAQLTRLGRRARERVLAEHSSDRRAEEFETNIASICDSLAFSRVAASGSARDVSPGEWAYRVAPQDSVVSHPPENQDSRILQKL